ncbi:hypothetical protein ACIQBJ_03460 [Kitasatospora sp. NPDC088391]|uniref:hypothetical protein n=1 Tax=Kitasatospora sp. NPDC088391 TaxID=3364074 RepID=UPI0038130962
MDRMVLAGGPGGTVRRWELAGGGAARFWEAELLGGTVRVRAGRTGADDGTGWGVHPFGDPAVASTRLAGMIADQERQGYRPVGAAPAVGGPLPDEDTPTLPDHWRTLVVPRRGGRAQSPADWPDAAAVAVEDALIAGNRTAVQWVCRSERTDPELLEAARAYLHGAADPLGAACVAAMLPPVHLPHRTAGGDLVDAWTARHGLAFAARAAVESFGIDYRAADPDAHRTGLTRPNRFTRHLGEAQTALLRWTRHLLSIAGRPAYEEARAAVAELRTDTDRRALAAYLFPAETGWVDAALDEFPSRHGNDTQVRQRQVLSALGTAAQVARLGATPPHGYVWTPAVVATLADGVGTACVPLLAAALRVHVDGEAVRELADYLLEFPSDEAFAALLERAEDRHVGPVLRQAADRQPVRATRMLAAAARSGRPMAGHLLDRHLRTHADVLPAILAELDATTAAFVTALEAAGPPAPTAPPEALPAVLTAPPWERPRRPARPKALPGLFTDPEPELRWQDGERAAWADPGHADDRWDHPESTDWAVEAGRSFGTGSPGQVCRLLRLGPAEVLTPYLASWRPPAAHGDAQHLRPVLARYGTAALPAVLHTVRLLPGSASPLLLPVLDADAARLLAEGLTTLKSVRGTARSWLARHGTAGALLLVPDAVGRPGPARTAAERALRLVAADTGAGALVAAVAERFGPAVAGPVEELLAADPLVAALPARMPHLPDWADPSALPPLLLPDGSALSGQAVRRVLAMAALTRPRDPYPGLAQVAEVLRPQALAAFCWALFQEWRLAGMPAKEGWALHLLGEFGDDAVARGLTPVLCEWPGQGAHRRAVEGLDVLAALGTDTALRQLHALAQWVKFKGLRTRAQEKVAELADGLGLTPDRLADRLVPDLGPSPDGGRE